jgi:hypothetical protein
MLRERTRSEIEIWRETDRALEPIFGQLGRGVNGRLAAESHKSNIFGRVVQDLEDGTDVVEANAELVVPTWFNGHIVGNDGVLMGFIRVAKFGIYPRGKTVYAANCRSLKGTHVFLLAKNLGEDVLTVINTIGFVSEHLRGVFVDCAQVRDVAHCHSGPHISRSVVFTCGILVCCLAIDVLW